MHGLQFTVIGTFKEKVESFGQSELNAETVVIPITVQQYFMRVERIDPLYVQVRAPDEVEAVTTAGEADSESRHRPGSTYKVENLTGILNAAKSIARILSLVLVLVSAIALVISGIGIMNIMLVTVTERTREIGLRMAVGASRREIMLQFLTEAVLISLGGGMLGIAAGVAVPLSVQFFVQKFRFPVSVVVDRDCVHGVEPGGAGLRDAAGQPRVALESDRSAALRIESAESFYYCRVRRIGGRGDSYFNDPAGR
jgi:putative ABC transport system permease protein